MVTIEEIHSKIKAVFEMAKTTYISDGAYAHLWPKEELINEQNSWGEQDGCSHADYSTAPVWFMHGDPEVPIEPIHTAEELIDYYFDGNVWGIDFEDQDDLNILSRQLNALESWYLRKSLKL